MLAQANRAGTPLALVIVDLDHFKNVNDTFGHECGDELLATVAAALASSVRASDFVGRFGGDEFVVALPVTAIEGALTLAEKMAAACHNAEVLGFSWEISASFGIATYPDHGATIRGVMRCADDALYKAKKDGRNCVRVASLLTPEAVDGLSSDPRPHSPEPARR